MGVLRGKAPSAQSAPGAEGESAVNSAHAIRWNCSLLVGGAMRYMLMQRSLRCASVRQTHAEPLREELPEGRKGV